MNTITIHVYDRLNAAGTAGRQSSETGEGKAPGGESQERDWGDGFGGIVEDCSTGSGAAACRDSQRMVRA